MSGSDGAPPAVVLGLSPTGLYAVRELGRAGVPVLGVASQHQAGEYSRYLSFGPGGIVEAGEARRLACLRATLAETPGKAVLIPASDQDIAFLLNHADALSEVAVWQGSYSNGLAAEILGKDSFYELCRAQDIAFAPYWKAPKSELRSLAAEARFPCLIKPTRVDAVKSAMGGRKGWVVKNYTDFNHAISQVPDGDTLWLVQEIVPGPESEITLYAAYFNCEGQAQQAFTARKLRQYPPGFGSASLVQSADEPETRELSEHLLKSMGYRGIAATEFKRDPRDGQLKIIESNPRPSLWFSVSTAAGKRITLAAYRDLTGQEPLDDPPQRQGVSWRYGPKDAYAAAFYRVRREFVLPPPELAAWRRPACSVSAVFSRDDPRPAWGDFANLGRKFWERLSRVKRRARER